MQRIDAVNRYDRTQCSQPPQVSRFLAQFSALDRAGITHLKEGQRVFVGVAEGQKGPEAASIQLA